MALQFWAQAILDTRYLIADVDHAADLGHLGVGISTLGEDMEEFGRLIDSQGDDDLLDHALVKSEVAIEEARALAERLGDARELVDITMHQANLRRSQARYIESFRLNERALAMSARLHGPIHDRAAVISENLFELFSDVNFGEMPSMRKALQHLLRALAIRLSLFELDHPALRVTLADVVDELQEQGRWECADILETTTRWGCPIGARVKLTQRFGGIAAGAVGLCVGLDQALREQAQVRLMILFDGQDLSRAPAQWWVEEFSSAEPSLWDADSASFVQSMALNHRRQGCSVVYLTKSQWKSKARLHAMPRVNFHAASSPAGDRDAAGFERFEAHPHEWPWNSMLPGP